MAEFEFKPEQKKIIEASGKNLLVSASAGSGKTTVMIERIFNKLVKKEVKIEDLLVLTYTTNAAEEMKQKLVKKLAGLSEEYEFLEEQMENIDAADISTIHSFCQRLIKKNFHLLPEIDINFSLLNSQEQAILRERAMKEVMLKFKESKPDDYFYLLSLYGKERNDNKITSLIFEIDKHLDATSDKEKFRKQVAFTMYQNPNIAYEILNQNFVTKIKGFVFRTEKLNKKARYLDSENCLATTSDVLLALRQISPENSFFKNLNLFLSFKFEKTKKDENFEELSQEIHALKKDISSFKTSIKNKNFDDENENNQSLLEGQKTLQILLELQKEFEEKYTLIKRKKNSLDFSDLERLAIKLTSKESVQKELREKYKLIFVDEFQDANEVQENLIKNLASGNNLFFVGDVKQSIYGFRRAKPQIFLDMQQKFKTDPNSQNMSLNLNFRSDQNILEFVNMIFKTIMTDKTAGLNYQTEAMFKPFKQLGDNGLERVKIVGVIKEKEEKQKASAIYSVLNQEETPDEKKQGEIEAYLVSQDIEKLQRTTIIDKDGKPRPVRHSDMTILVRKRGDFFDSFCKKLVELGVPIYANNSRSLFEEPDAKKFIALFRLAQSFHDDYSLAAVMTSFFASFTFQDLADIKLAQPNQKYFFQSVIAYSKTNKDELAEKIENFIVTIEQFFENVQIKGVFFALSDILQKTSYVEKVLCLPEGKQRVQAIERFLNLLTEGENNFNINSFLEFVEIENNEIKAPNFFAGDQDCVNVTTIHSSKGLEYPIVFLVEMGSDFTKAPPKAEVKIHDDLGVGLKYYSDKTLKKEPSICYEAIDIVNKKEEFSEKLRLLYVGLTRAVEYMYIYGKIEPKNIETYENDWQVFEAKSYMELILGALEKTDLETLMQHNFALIDTPLCRASVQLYKDSENKEREKEVEANFFTKGDLELEEGLLQSLKTEYKFKNATSIALKNSVSSIIKHEYYESFNAMPQKLVLSEHLTTEKVSQEEGILYHKIFEILDFESVENETDIENQLLKANINPEIIDKTKVLNVVNLIKPFTIGNKHFKEQKFMMYVPYNEVVESEITDKILVQGVIDLFVLGNKNILIDYKLTHLGDDNLIKKRYVKQLTLYKKAVMEFYNVQEIECVIVDINRQKLIKL